MKKNGENHHPSITNMKQLNRMLQEEVRIMDNQEMKKILGGDATPTGCAGKSKEACSGNCLIDGTIQGKCGWTAANINRCTCGGATIG